MCLLASTCLADTLSRRSILTQTGRYAEVGVPRWTALDISTIALLEQYLSVHSAYTPCLNLTTYTLARYPQSRSCVEGEGDRVFRFSALCADASYVNVIWRARLVRSRGDRFGIVCFGTWHVYQSPAHGTFFSCARIRSFHTYLQGFMNRPSILSYYSCSVSCSFVFLLPV